MRRITKKLAVKIAFATAAIAIAVPVISTTPVFATIREAGTLLVQRLNKPQVQLALRAEKQVLEKENQTAWRELAGQVQVQPGDVLRYTVEGKNVGEKQAKKLVVTQPIPQRTTFVLESAGNDKSAATLYSIDGGKTFTPRPMVQVTQADGQVVEQPAPAQAYTHVRWNFGDQLGPDAQLKASYQVKVN
jgi:uncharacterized repeat protein (TIGR01451 family)